jgi:CPA1 family monovalent cation:H+ antiporter
LLDVIAILVVLSALLAYVSHRFLRLPMTIGVMATARAAARNAFRNRACGFASYACLPGGTTDDEGANH